MQLPSVLSPGNCAFVEQDGKIIDPETGSEASINAPCVERGGSIGYNAAAAETAVSDVQEALNAVFNSSVSE